LGWFGLLLGYLAFGYFLRQYLVDSKIKSVQEQANKILEQAKATAQTLQLETKEDVLKNQK